jgi:glycosyltransferase involved in cell wall biosynthesis
VTDIGGPLESIFHGETGLVVKGNDVEAMIDGIGIIMHDDELRAGMSRKAREFVEERTFENAFEEYWRFYLKPIACSPPAAGESNRLDPAAQAI